MATLAAILTIAGAPADCEFEAEGKWLVSDQRGSKGIMEQRVAKLKAAGIPAFFSAGQRKWGVLAEKVQA